MGLKDFFQRLIGWPDPRDEEIELAKESFRFLADKGFSIEKEYKAPSFPYWLVCYSDGNLKICLTRDRSDLVVSFGPNWASVDSNGRKKSFWGLELILAYLLEEEVWPPGPIGDATEFREILGLVRASTKKYFSVASEFVSSDEFTADTEAGLNKVVPKLVDYWVKNYKRPYSSKN